MILIGGDDKSVYVIPLTAIKHGMGGDKRRKIKSKRNSIIFNYILEQCSKKIDKIFL